MVYWLSEGLVAGNFKSVVAGTRNVRAAQLSFTQGQGTPWARRLGEGWDGLCFDMQWALAGHAGNAVGINAAQAQVVHAIVNRRPLYPSGLNMCVAQYLCELCIARHADFPGAGMTQGWQGERQQASVMCAARQRLHVRCR